MNDYIIDLASFDATFQSENTEQPREFKGIPDGTYEVVVEKVELTESQRSSVPMIRWTLRVLDSRFRDRLLWRNQVISDHTIRFLRKDLEVCGLNLEKLSDLPTRLGELLGVRLEVAKKAKGDYQNVYFNRRIDPDRSGSQCDNRFNDGLLPF
jgi:hypothetical protein